MRKQTKIVAALSATALLALGASAVTFAAGWDNSTGAWQYLDNNGSAVTDAWRKSGDYWFYLDSDGSMATDKLIQDGDDYYYVNGDGAMVSNQWVALATDDDSSAEYRWFYFGSDGKAYRDHNEQVTVSDLKTINGKKYAFDQDGKMLYGWIDKDSNTIKTGDDAWVDADYYFGGWNDGSAQNGWVQLTVNTDSVRSGDGDGSDTFWFYFDNNGKKQSNKKKNINGYTFYFDKYGRMIEDWSTATKNGADGFDTPANATDSIVYTNADGAARKNQWVWAVPSEDYDKDDYDNDSYSWWWAQGNGKIFKDGIRKIKGKSYAFDEKGRMLSGIVGVVDGHYTNKYNGKDKWLDLSKDAYLDQAASLGADQKLYYFSSDEKKDGSRKSGYQNVEFDDDSYQMYFKTNGEAENNYVSKIKKYVAYGVVLKADNEESNLAGVQVDSANRKKLVGRNVEYYGTANIADGNHVLVNAAGAVQEKKTNVKDSNDVYYLTDKDGVILYAGDKKTYNSKSKDHENEITLPNGKKVYTE